MQAGGAAERFGGARAHKVMLLSPAKWKWK